MVTVGEFVTFSAGGIMVSWMVISQEGRQLAKDMFVNDVAPLFIFAGCVVGSLNVLSSVCDAVESVWNFKIY